MRIHKKQTVISLTSGRNVYVINGIIPSTIFLLSMLDVVGYIWVYFAVIICHGLTCFYYNNKGVVARFNAAQSLLLALITAGIVIVEYHLFGFEQQTMANAIRLAFRLAATNAREWVFTLSMWVVALLYPSANIFCWSCSRQKVLPLPVIGGWAWQSAKLDDTTGEYAPLEEASKEEENFEP